MLSSGASRTIAYDPCGANSFSAGPPCSFRECAPQCAGTVRTFAIHPCYETCTETGIRTLPSATSAPVRAFPPGEASAIVPFQDIDEQKIVGVSAFKFNPLLAGVISEVCQRNSCQRQAESAIEGNRIRFTLQRRQNNLVILHDVIITIREEAEQIEVNVRTQEQLGRLQVTDEDADRLANELKRAIIERLR